MVRFSVSVPPYIFNISPQQPVLGEELWGTKARRVGLSRE